MLQKPYWQRLARRLTRDGPAPGADDRTSVRALDLAALEPKLLFSAGPLPIHGDGVLDNAAAGANDPVLLAELLPLNSAPLPVNPSDLVSGPGYQEAAHAANPPLAISAGDVATIDNRLLSASDVDTTPAQLTYTITGSSAGGIFSVSRTTTTTFSQEDIDLGRVTYEQTGTETNVDQIDFELNDGQGTQFSATIDIDVASVNSAPVLNDSVVVLNPVAENAGVPVGAVGTLISDLVDLTPSSQSVERTDVIPFYSAGSGNNAQRSITWWWAGWDDWATKVKVSLEQHGTFWQHLPYGRVFPGPMDFDGRSDAANGVPGVHDPLPHIAEGLEHYLQQVVTPDDQLFFYFGAPSLIYTEGMTYADYEETVLAELSDVLGLADNAKVSIGFDATYGQPTSLGGIWTVLGGPTGYNAQVLQKIASFGVNIILEPWIYQGATWAYDYDTIYTETFYRAQELDQGALPLSSHQWASSELLTGDKYRLPRQSHVDLYYDGSWETAIVEILAAGDIPLGRLVDSTSLFEPAWVEFADEVIDPSSLVPLPGYNPPGTSSLDQLEIVGDVDFATLFSHLSEIPAWETSSVEVGGVLAPAIIHDNVYDADSLITGIAITSADTTHGTWWYSTDGGQSWDGLGSVSTSSARLLAANSLTRIYFEPDAGYSGAATSGFTFQAWDRSDGFDNGTAGIDASNGGGTSAFSAESDFASVSVSTVNDAPTIEPIADQVASEDTLLGPIALTVGDVDNPVTDLVVTATSSHPAIIPQENISITGSGANRALSIAPAPDQHGGPVTIRLTVSDGEWETMEQFDVVVTPQQDVPVAADDFFVVSEDQTLSIAGPGPLGNDSDRDGDPLTWLVVSGPAHGMLLTQPDSSFQYTPAAGFTGSDAFQYVAHDGLAASNIATVHISVSSVNDAPTIDPVADQVASEDTLLGPIALTVGDVDNAVTELVVTATSSDPTIIPSGNISITGSGGNRSLSIQPAPDQHGGPVTITVTVSDGEWETMEQFDVVVTPQQDVPVAADDFFVVSAGQTLSIAGPGPLANDSDRDGDPLTWGVVAGPAHGTLLTQSDGSFQYTPVAGFTGNDAFQYVADDGLAASNVATVRISVQPDLAPPPPEAEAPPERYSPPQELLPGDPAAEDLQVGIRPRRVTDLPATNDPAPATTARQRMIAITGGQPSPAGVQGSESDLAGANSLIVPRRSNPLPAEGEVIPNQPASQSGQAEGESLPSRVETDARLNGLDELNKMVQRSEEIERLADSVAVGLSSALAAGYVLSRARGKSTPNPVLAPKTGAWSWKSKS